jgi:tetratricopeptide (TPR) repeat protein
VGLDARAEAAYQAFQEHYPQSAYGFRDLGSLRRDQGRLKEAQALLERAVMVSPRDSTSWLGLAYVSFDQSLWVEAEEALDTYGRLAPFAADGHALRGRLRLAQGDEISAAKAWQQSLFLKESVSLRLELAELYRQMGRSRTAAAQCQAAGAVLLRSDLRPLDVTLKQVGACLAGTGADDIEARSLTHAREPFFDHILRGHTRRARGETKRALAAYQHAAPLRSDEGGLHYWIGETYEVLGDPDLAEAAYRLAAELDPQESMPWLALGRLQWAEGQTDAAVESYRRAGEITPGWGQARAVLGNALLSLGDRVGAANEFRAAKMVFGDWSAGIAYDFVAELAEASVQSPSPAHVKHDVFQIGGDERRVLFMHPESSTGYTVHIPQDSVLAFSVATAPESWVQPGDGVVFMVHIETEQGRYQLFSTYIDPKKSVDARRWHAHTVDLGAYAGQSVTLIFETVGGPAGDERYDWAGWGRPRLLH